MACLQTLNGLGRTCDTSMGGINEVYIANYEDITSVEYSTDGGEITGITMNSGAKFKKYWFRKGTGSLTKTLNVSENGSNFVQSDLVLQFDRMETKKRIEMAALSVGDLAVLVKDGNGKVWFLGEEAPVRASAGDGQTGTARSDGNRYSITLQDENSTFPKEVSASLTDITEVVA